MVANAIVDISHHQNVVEMEKVLEAGIIAVIHKATQGTKFIDPRYKERADSAASLAILWGAYHFGTGGDGVRQAEHFLKIVKPSPHTLLALDLEDNAHGPTMTLIEAEAFAVHVQKVTGRWPGIYSGHFIKRALTNTTNPILSQCWFWLAQYGPTPVVPVCWQGWTLWQYTDGALGNGPYEVNGIGRCDRDKFNGSEQQLRKFWRNEV